jgi:hypothetical protein
MLWVTTALLLSASSALTASVEVGPRALALASTYDEAACDAPNRDSVADADGDCSLGPVPLASECDASFWVGEMSGSCEQPRPSGGPALRPYDPAAPKLCDGIHCDDVPSPLRAVPRTTDTGAALILSAPGDTLALEAAPLAAPRVEHPTDAVRPPLERPPRA